MSLVNETVGTREYPNIINDGNPALQTFSVKIKAGSGKLVAGTVLALTTEGTHEVLGSGTGVANAILADDVDATAETVATAYRAGHFNGNMLTVADGYTLKAEDKENLRKAGIVLSDAVKY